MENELIIETLHNGNGAVAEQYSILTVEYTGVLANCTVFDSSCKPDRYPLRFTLGVEQIIAGWDEGLMGLEKRGN